MPTIQSYHGLYWGAIIAKQQGEEAVAFLRDQAIFQHWRLSTGELCIGIALPGTPQLPAAFVASAKQLRSIPAEWVAKESLEPTLRQFRERKLQLPPSICQALYQEELFYLSRPGAAEEELAPVCSDGTWGGGTLFGCLLLFEEQVDMLFALHVPDEWRLARPYWSGCQLFDVLTMEDHDVVAGIPFTHCLEAPARFVLIQDVQGGIFAEIHCLCGTAEGVISVIEVVDILANDQARTWLQGQQNTQWEDMAQQIQSWGLHSF